MPSVLGTPSGNRAPYWQDHTTPSMCQTGAAAGVVLGECGSAHVGAVGAMGTSSDGMNTL
jgi:hypothetical protein